MHLRTYDAPDLAYADHYIIQIFSLVAALMSDPSIDCDVIFVEMDR